jgi:ParB family chromosome partitioning protein
MADEGRSRLGRGLAALIGEAQVPAAAIDRAQRTPRRLPVAYLRANPRNPRKSFLDGDLADLTASVKERGVLQPLIVRPVAATGDAYEIVAGERRWRAAQRAGLHDVPVIIREATDKESLELAIIENVQRADLNVLEEARGYQALADQYHYSQSELAAVIGKSKSHIANTLRLLNLPDAVQAFILDGKLTAGHARALLTLDDPLGAAERILAEGLTVRDVEAIDASGGRKKGAGGRKPRAKDADTRALEKSLSDLLGLKVEIDHKSGGGQIHIHYASLEQLDDVCRRLRG